MRQFAALALWFSLVGLAGRAAVCAEDQSEPSPQPGQVRMLVVTGGHDFETSFFTIFEGYDDLAWSRVASNQEAFRFDLRPRYDVLVLYDMSNDLDEAGKRNLKDFVEAGKGVVVLHHAILDYAS